MKMLLAALGFYLAGTLFAAWSVRRADPRALVATRLMGALGALLHAVVLFMVGVQDGHFPVTNAVEAFLFLSTGVMFLALFLDWLRGWPVLVVATLPLALVTSLLALALGLTSPAEAPPPPRVSSVWTSLHVVVALASYGAFALAFLSALLYLVAQRSLKHHAASTLLGFMPSLEAMARLNVRAIGVGVILLVAGLVVGYLQARSLYPGQRAWRVDPKIILTTLTVVAYAAVLVLSGRPAFKGRRTALASVFSFALVVTTFWASVFWSDFHRFR